MSGRLGRSRGSVLLFVVLAILGLVGVIALANHMPGSAVVTVPVWCVVCCIYLVKLRRSKGTGQNNVKDEIVGGQDPE